MPEQHAVVVQRYLDELTGDTPAEPVVRALLDRAVGRLRPLCANLLYRSYLTFEAEKRGAEVVSFDISDARHQHLLPPSRTACTTSITPPGGTGRTPGSSGGRTGTGWPTG